MITKTAKNTSTVWRWQGRPMDEGDGIVPRQDPPAWQATDTGLNACGDRQADVGADGDGPDPLNAGRDDRGHRGLALNSSQGAGERSGNAVRRPQRADAAGSGGQGCPRHPRQLRHPQASQGARVAGATPAWASHFTPTSCPWLNAVEGVFAKMSRQCLRRRVLCSVGELTTATHERLAVAVPIRSGPKPRAIMAAVKRGHQVLEEQKLRAQMGFPVPN